MKILLSAALALILAPIIGEIPWMGDIGNLFINLLKMIAVPLVFVSIGGAFSKLSMDITGGICGAFQMLFMFLLSLQGIFIGKEVARSLSAPLIPVEADLVEPASLSGVFMNIIPENPAASFASGNMLQIIFLSVIIGLAASQVEEKENIQSFFDTARDLCMKIAGWVMKTAPIGVFALLYTFAAKSIGDVLYVYAAIAVALLLGILITFVVAVFSMWLYGFDARGLILFLKVVIPGDIVGALAGGATNYMAPRMKAIKEKTDIQKDAVDLLIPFTSVVMRLGSCVCVGVYTVFAARAFGASPDWFLFPVVSILALMAAPGIIGGTLMDCVIIWAAIGIPVEAIALFAGFDYFMDVMRTILNIFGGEAVTYMAPRREGKI